MIGKSLPHLCLLLLGVLVLAEGFCYRKNPPRSQESIDRLNQPGNYSIWVCVQSMNFTADLDKAPKANISQVWFSMSRVDKLQADAFANFADKLVKIEIWSSNLAEVDEDAFKGLKELKGLILPRNQLTEFPAAWFKETPKLLELNLANNRITYINNFLKLVPNLVSLDLSNNNIRTLHPGFISNLSEKLRLNIYGNPLNYNQLRQVVSFITTKSKAKEERINEPRLKELKYVLNVTKACSEDKAVDDKTISGIESCVSARMSKELALLNPANISIDNATTPKP